MKCMYNYCLHASNEIDPEDLVTEGKKHFHSDCYRTKEQLKEIIDIFSKRVNPNVVFSNLNNVVRNIVFKKNVGSDFLLFGLNYYLDNKIPLNYPQGLYYVIQNKDVQREYEKIQARKMVKNKPLPKEIVEEKPKFEYTPPKKKGINDIFGGL